MEPPEPITINISTQTIDASPNRRQLRTRILIRSSQSAVHSVPRSLEWI